MNPKKAKNTSTDTAKELELDSSLVEDILSFYWKELRKTLTEGKDISVMVTGVGCFKVREIVLPKILDRYKKMLEGRDPSSFKKAIIYTKIEGKINIINSMLNKIRERKEERRKFMINKYGELNKNLEK